MKRSVAIATFVMFSNAGAVTSSFIYLPSMAPRYITGHTILLSSMIIVCSLSTILTLWFRKENARRDAIKPAGLYTREEKMEDSEKGDYARFFRFTI